MVALAASKLRSKDNEIAFIECRVNASYPDYSEACNRGALFLPCEAAS